MLLISQMLIVLKSEGFKVALVCVNRWNINDSNELKPAPDKSIKFWLALH